MYKYKSKCRWNMLLCVDDKIVEIRPGELFESAHFIDSRYLNCIKPQKIIAKKKGKLKKNTFSDSIEAKTINANSSSTQS